MIYKKLKRKFLRWAFRVFSGDPSEESGHYCVPPGSANELIFGENDDDGQGMFLATTYNNDGFELWIAYRNGKWLFHCRHDAARRLAWFVLWDWWIISTWCGLKRRIWYWVLHHKIIDDREWAEYFRSREVTL